MYRFVLNPHLSTTITVVKNPCVCDHNTVNDVPLTMNTKLLFITVLYLSVVRSGTRTLVTKICLYYKMIILHVRM